jgi:hypothetical protein
MATFPQFVATSDRLSSATSRMAVDPTSAVGRSSAWPGLEDIYTVYFHSMALPVRTQADWYGLGDPRRRYDFRDPLPEAVGGEAGIDVMNLSSWHSAISTWLFFQARFATSGYAPSIPIFSIPVSTTSRWRSRRVPGECDQVAQIEDARDQVLAGSYVNFAELKAIALRVIAGRNTTPAEDVAAWARRLASDVANAGD